MKKGIVFTEFIEFVEQSYGLDAVDDMLEGCQLKSGGAYTAVGTYDHRELVGILLQLSEQIGTSVSGLLNAFGQHLLGRFSERFPVFFDDVPSAFEFLKTIENSIHVEVRKLYPDAELPSFSHDQPSADRLVLHYTSSRGMPDLAEGLIRGTLDHFEERASIVREDLSDGAGTEVRFTLDRC